MPVEVKEDDKAEEENKLLDAEESSPTETLSSPTSFLNSRAVQIPFWFGVLMVASVGMTVGNKAVMHAYPYANALSFYQNGVTVVFLLIGQALNLVEINKITTTQLKIFATNAALLSAQILTSLLAMPLVCINCTFRSGLTICL